MQKIGQHICFVYICLRSADHKTKTATELALLTQTYLVSYAHVSVVCSELHTIQTVIFQFYNFI